MYFKVDLTLRLRGVEEALNLPLAIDTDAEGSAQPVLDDFVNYMRHVFADSRNRPCIFRIDFLQDGELNKIGWHPENANRVVDFTIDFHEVSLYTISTLSVVE
jgi:hypothetical protein